MDLLQFSGVGAVLSIPPADCATLARLCLLAEEQLPMREEQAEAQAARTYAALFRACALGGMTPGWLVRDAHQGIYEELAGLGLGDLLKPIPGGRAEVTE
jgi:hypothetical protein